jgi:hypothetical protein
MLGISIYLSVYLNIQFPSPQIFLAVLEFELRVPCLLGRHTTTSAMSPDLFCFIFQIRYCFFPWVVLRWRSYQLWPHVVGITDVCHYTWHIVWDGVLANFILGLVSTAILSISSSWVGWDYRQGQPRPAVISIFKSRYQTEPLISSLGKLRQEDYELQASLGCLS